MNRPNSKSEKNELIKYAFERAKQEAEDNKTILEAYNSEKIQDYTEHEEYRSPLSIDTQKIITIQLSWGGDADGYKITVSKDNEIISGVYFWQDWGVYEEVNLSDTELDDVVQLYFYGGIENYLQ